MKKNIRLMLMTSIFATTSLFAGAQDLRSLPIPAGPINEMAYTPSVTHFSLWAPTAEKVVVNIYANGEGGAVEATHDLQRSTDGTWTANVSGDLKGKFFTFQVTHKGKKLAETPGMFATAVGVNGQRAQIIDPRDTAPDGWENDKRPELKSFADVVIYEMHHRDFSIDEASGIKNKGKFLALTEQGTKNAEGYSTGIDHLKELGINHVHILPSYDYGSVNEAQAYLRQSMMRTNPNSSSLPKAQYNWGYDPVNYNVPEGSYSTNPYDGTVRIKEFKQMVQSLHKAGIRVVLDVVYNHVFDAGSSQFQRIVPDYFFRHRADGSLSDGSGCGNETASDMPMMRKYMVESVLHWIREYHIDGLRFDLMGVHDIATMQAIRHAVDAVDPTIFIYGEGWAASAPALPESELAMKANTAQIPGIAAFGDEFRDGLRGGWSDEKKGAFLIGDAGHEESVKFGIVGAIQHPQVDMSKVNYSKKAWAAEPTQSIAYVSCHDDMCIADRLKVTMRDGNNDALRKRLQKLAETAVMTSQGVPFIWCGDEILRDKKGVHNSYNSPDSINTIPWANKTEHNDLFTYVKQLIAIRKAHPAFRMGSAEAVRANLQFIPYKGSNVIAFRLNGAAVGDEWSDIVVVFNSRNTSVRVPVSQNEYTVVCYDGKIDVNGIHTTKGKTVKVAPQSALIMYRK